MKNLLLYLLLTGGVSAVSVALLPVPETTVSGRVLDHVSKLPLDFVKVSLIDSTGTRARAEGFTDSAGRFKIELEKKGKYRIVASLIGYKEYKSPMMELIPGQVLKDILLEVDPEELSEIVIEEKTGVHRNAGLSEKKIKEETRFRGRTEDRKMAKPAVVLGEPALDFERIPEPGMRDDVDSRVEAGTLTAGEVNDFAKWKLWEDLTEKEFDQYARVWKLNMRERYSVQLTTENGLPVVDAEVKLLNTGGGVEFIGRTDNTGKVELWSGMSTLQQPEMNRKPSIEVNWQGSRKTFRRLQAFPNGLNTFVLEQPCEQPMGFDISFVVDATGSMGDEILYLKMELADVIQRITAANPALKYRTSSVFYKDHGDDYVTVKSDFSEAPMTTLDFVKTRSAGGGGDVPEAVDEALEVAINQLDWSNSATGRVIFLVLDAPPHLNDSTVKKMHRLVYTAASKGIRIIPVTGSGIDKGVEFLMRSMALATNGTYVFLTDDSGIGNPHLKPSTDTYQVEKLNDLMVRLIGQYSVTHHCKLPQAITADTLQTQLPVDTINGTDTAMPSVKLTLRCFPVPTYGPLDVEVNVANGELFVADVQGKFVYRFDMKERKTRRIDLTLLSSGTYFVKYQLGGRWVSEKIVVYH